MACFIILYLMNLGYNTDDIIRLMVVRVISLKVNKFGKILKCQRLKTR